MVDTHIDVISLNKADLCHGVLKVGDSPRSVVNSNHVVDADSIQNLKSVEDKQVKVSIVKVNCTK